MDTIDATTPPIDGVVGVCGTAVSEPKVGMARRAGTAVAGGAPVSWVGTAAPTAVRLRVPMTGLPIGSGAFYQLNSDTPGDLPPRDPLS